MLKYLIKLICYDLNNSTNDGKPQFCQSDNKSDAQLFASIFINELKGYIQNDRT